MTETRQNLSQQVKCRRGRAVGKAWADRTLLLRAADHLSCLAALRLKEVFTLDDPTCVLQTVCKVKEQLRALLRSGSVEDVAEAKKVLECLVKAAARPETTKLYRGVCRWRKLIKALIITGATTRKVEANNTHRPRGIATPQLQIGCSLEKSRQDGGMRLIPSARGFSRDANPTQRIPLWSAGIAVRNVIRQLRPLRSATITSTAPARHSPRHRHRAASHSLCNPEPQTHALTR